MGRLLQVIKSNARIVHHFGGRLIKEEVTMEYILSLLLFSAIPVSQGPMVQPCNSSTMLEARCIVDELGPDVGSDEYKRCQARGGCNYH